MQRTAHKDLGTDLSVNTTEPIPQDPIPIDSTNITSEALTKDYKEIIPQPKDELPQ